MNRCILDTNSNKNNSTFEFITDVLSMSPNFNFPVSWNCFETKWIFNEFKFE